MTGMKIHTLSTGVMGAGLTWLLWNPRPWPADPVWDEYPVDDECSTYVVLVEHPEGRVLWDSGTPRGWEPRWTMAGVQDFFPLREPVDETGFLDTALAKLDLTPDDIDILVLPYLRFDHASTGRLFDPAKTRILASAAELDRIKTTTERDGSDFDGLFINGIAGDEEILPGIRVIQVPGHVMSLWVDLDRDGMKIFTCSAVHIADSRGSPEFAAALSETTDWTSNDESDRQVVSAFAK
ncbi:MAG TPA: N-acyl homoserine lactonase family protein [Pseudonocardiaceae bacterium]